MNICSHNIFIASFAMMIMSCVGSTDATAEQRLSSGATVAQALGIAPPQRHSLLQTESCRTQECFDAALQQQINDAAKSILKLSRPLENVTAGREPGLAYYNTLTDEYFVGDRVFHRDDYNAALETMGRRNTKAPSGLGWRALAESSYIAYIRSVQGLETPMDQTIYNNCVIARSRGTSENVLREVRASCRETARNPSRLERWRWAD